jgi:pyruvate dehydrogenase E1 component beta subunit
MVKVNLVEAIKLALEQEMYRDKNVVLLGEDIGEDGGVFRVTDGLAKKFGNERVIDSPLAESGIVGVSIGMAAMGLKPVCEIQFEGFTFPAIDQLVSHATRIRNRSRGTFTCPMVLRCPIGGGVKALEHHSDSPESYFIHTPGLKVVIPSTPFDAKGLLIAAIRDPDPVIFFEPKKIYRSIKEEIPDKEYILKIGKINVVKEGRDVTLITYGASVKTCFELAMKFKDKIDIEVIDLRTLSPLDLDGILKSVNKTGKVIIVHEAPRTLGFGAEISSQIYEKALNILKSPIERVTGFDTVVPARKFEQYYFPDEKRIVRAIEKVVNKDG